MVWGKRQRRQGADAYLRGRADIGITPGGEAVRLAGPGIYSGGLPEATDLFEAEETATYDAATWTALTAQPHPTVVLTIQGAGYDFSLRVTGPLMRTHEMINDAMSELEG